MNHIVNSSNITVVQSVSYVEDMSINDLFVSISVIVMERQINTDFALQKPLG